MKNFLIHLLNYEFWANQRIISALESLDNQPPSAVAVMSHILSAQHVWLGRILHEPTVFAIWENLPVASMNETAERQHRQLVNYVSGLAELDLIQPIDYVNSSKQPYQSTLIDILTHISHHAAYHRGQVVQLIRPMLAEAPVTDFIIWTREG
ncbi:MAG TPA: DinB family protein [Spirosoma sp.]|jgi:uncharacterized damage-inducible protein DinB|nr:DinB family protein [Spirosoma sp.]